MKAMGISSIKNEIAKNQSTFFTFPKQNQQLLEILKKRDKLSISKAIDRADIKIGLEFEFYLKDGKKLEELINAIGEFANKLYFKPEEFNTKDKDLEAWTMERDGTLSPIREGFELVSPKIDLKDAQFYIKNVLSIIRSYGETDRSCGMHFHISSENSKLKNLDITKLMLFLDNRDTLSAWENRSPENIELRDIFKKTKLSVFSKHFKDLSRFYSIAQRGEDGMNNHLEVRSIGGEDYHRKEDLILDDFKSFIDSYYIGCNPMYEYDLHKELMQEFIENNKENLKEALTIDEIIEASKHLSVQRDMEYEHLSPFDLRFLLEEVMYRQEQAREKLVPTGKLLTEIENHVNNYEEERYGR